MGGPNDTQKRAQAQLASNAQQEGQLANWGGGKFQSLYGQAQPFYSSEMKNGLPFYNNLTDFNAGTTAQAFAPAKADFLRRSAGMGSLPSGFRATGMNDINEAQGKAFDSNLVNNMMANWQAKQQGAQGLTGLMQTVNPAAFYGGSSTAANAAEQPLQPGYHPWLAGLAGGVSGALNPMSGGGGGMPF